MDRALVGAGSTGGLGVQVEEEPALLRTRHQQRLARPGGLGGALEAASELGQFAGLLGQAPYLQRSASVLDD